VALEPKEIDVDGKKYLIHKFPAWEGILLVGRIPQAMAFTQENLQASGEVWAEVFSYIAVPMPKGGSPLFLTNQDLVNNHVKGWKQMLALFRAIMEYNDGFLENGKL
jgi:hypothetical protein